MHLCEKDSHSKSHESKISVTQLRKVRSMNISKETFNVNYSIMRDEDNKTYHGDVIGKSAIEAQTFDKWLKGI